MTAPFDPHPAAALLTETWNARRQIDALPLAVAPSSLEQGYLVQDRFIDATGDAVCGWKLGVGSPAAMQAAGASRPLVGRLLSSRCYLHRDEVVLSDAGPVTAEFEIVFVLGCDVWSDSDMPLRTFVEAAHVGFEFVLSRYVDRRSVGQPGFAADNVGFEACVVGPRIALDEVEKVASTVAVHVDGVERARGLQGDAATDPWLSLQYLVEHARERNLTLKRGELVFTGASAKPLVIDQKSFELAATFLDSDMRVRAKVGEA
ncbi:hydratase [Paraburkholderia xenovorans]|uniref:2-keto-4-pentenoate hydratase n=1 Tax=Paraburkholderia xenovorans TaxID=36873 RepID=UPI0038BA4E50